MKGTGPIIVQESKKSRNLTLILAISLKYGVVAYQILDKGLNQASFLVFLKELKD